MIWPQEHWDRVKRLALKLHTDGCSGVPDLWFRLCCFDHDIAYRTGCTVDGTPITRAEADANLRHCMQDASPVGIFSPLALIYWTGVRLFGAKAYTPEED